MAYRKTHGRTKKIGLFSRDYMDFLGSIGAESIILAPFGDVQNRDSLAVLEEKLQEKAPATSGKKDAARCLTCGVSFKNREEQVAHYQLDWHRYNLKRRLKGLSSVHQDQFEKIADDLSSISGSESDSGPSDENTSHRGEEEDDDDDGNDADNDDNDIDYEDRRTRLPSKKSPYLHFSLKDHGPATYSMLRCILPHSHPEGTGSNLYQSLSELSNPRIWIILMRSGGHFAGAVYRGSELVAHKTFHRYTVRAKRGTSQSVRDGQQGGHQPKSAGASLRRYNEAALTAEIRNLIGSWSSSVKEASCIFLRTPKHSKGLFVGEKGLFPRGDERLRSIPFQTRRPTLTEVRATFGRLSSLYVSSNPEAAEHKLSRTGRVEEKKEHDISAAEGKSEVGGATEISSTVDHIRSEMLYELQLEGNKMEEETKPGDEGEGEEEGDEGAMASGDQGSASKQRKQKKKKRLEKGAQHVPKVVLPSFINQLLLLAADSSPGSSDQYHDVLCSAGLRRTFGAPMETLSDELPRDEAVKQLNTTWNGDTVLHTAALNGHLSLIPILMEYGANPTVRNGNGQTPYAVSKNKAARDVFRRFMAAHPSAWDYSAAQIPSPLTEEMEQERGKREAEKRKERKKKKAKDQQERQERARKEEEERTAEQGQKRVLGSLTQREKQALAAERRMASQLLPSTAALSARVCSGCGNSLLGVVPFERLDYKYCSMDCLKQHRTVLSQHKH